MGRSPLQPNAENCSQSDLETAMKAAPMQQAYIRMMAIRTLLLGFDREQVAAIHQVSDETLRRWILAFNDRGIDGLIDAPRPGRPPKIPADKTDELREALDDPSQAERTHWTGRAFHGFVCKTLNAEIGYSTVIDWMHRQRYALKVPQPWPDRQDEEKREAFLERLRELLLDPDVDLWSMDEMGAEGDPRPRRRWVEKGKKSRVTKNGDHIRMNVAGMVCPRTGEFFALQMSHSDRECFQVFLDQANEGIEFKRKRNLLIMDNASWHKSASLDWGGFEPEYLPAYSPDFNPIERLWLVIKNEWFTDFIAKNRAQLITRLDQALNWTIDRQNDNQKTCAIRT